MTVSQNTDAPTASKPQPTAVKPAPLNPRQRRDVDHATDVVKRMLDLGPELKNRTVLMEQMRAFGLAFNGWPGLHAYQDWFNSSKFGLLQLPTEFVDYLLYAADKNPSSAAEIGIFTGGTSVFSSAFFQALNPDFHYTGIDITNRLIVHDRLLAPLNIDFVIGKTSEAFVGKPFDIVFIDGNHSYEWAKRDYLNMGRHARQICAFHDVHAVEYEPQGGGVYRFWRQLRSSLAMNTAMLEIAHAPPGAGKAADGRWMGIGLLDYTR